MAVVTKYLKTSNPGADPDVYTSLDAWNTNEATDLVSAGDSHVLECDAGVYVGDVTIAGWTTGPSNTVTIKAAAGDEHNGVPGAGVHFTVNNFDQIATVICNISNFRLFDVEISQTAFRAAFDFEETGSGLLIDRCILRGSSSSGGNAGGALNLGDTSDQIIRNSILIQTRTGQSLTGVIRYLRGSGDSPIFQNCTLVGERGVYGAGSSAFQMPLFENCVFATSLEAANGSGGTTFPAGTRYNAFWGAQTTFGTNTVTGIGSSDFVDEPNDDYSIDATSALYDAGVDLSAEFTEDIANTTITDWSIGAFTFVSAATPTNIGPTVGSVSLAGAAGPDLGLSEDIAAGQGSIALSGNANSLSAQSDVSPGQASASLAGSTGPDIDQPQEVTAGQGSMVLSGNAANVDVPSNVAPGLETVAISGQPVDLTNAETIAAGQGGASLTGQPLTVASPANIQPGQGTYGITGIAVSVLTSVEIAPALGSTALTGFDLSVLADVDIAAGIGSLSLNGFSVSVDDEQITSINPGAGSIALAGEIVGLSAVSDLTPGAGSMALSGEAVDLSSGFTLSPGVAAITCAGMAVTLDASALITPGLAELALMGQAANVAQPEDISPATASLAISGQTASIYNPVSLSIDIGGIAVTGLSVSLELIEGDGPEPFTGLLLMSKQENVYLSGKKEHIYVASKVKSTLVTAIK